MDGYAINVDNARNDKRQRLYGIEFLEKSKIIGKATAGHPYYGDLNQDAAIQIMTGAMVPAGYDTVVINEDVTVSTWQPKY